MSQELHKTEEELKDKVMEIYKPIYEKQMELAEVINEAMVKMMDLGQSFNSGNAGPATAEPIKNMK